MEENKFSEAELRYRTLFEQSPYAILVIDTNGNAHRQKNKENF